MIQHIKNIIKVLDRWFNYYLLSAFLLVIGIALTSLEPKILQIAVDYVRSVLGEEKERPSQDFISELFYHLLSQLPSDHIGWILASLGSLYLLIALARGSFLLVSSALNANSTEKAMKSLRDTMFMHLQKLPLSYFVQTSKGELIQRATGDMDTVKNFAQNQIVEVIRLTAIFLFAFSMMAIVYWPYAIISVALVPLITWGGFIFFKKERIVWEEHEEEADRLNKCVQENLNGIRLVMASSSEDYEIQKFEEQNQRKLKVGLKHAWLHTHFWPFSEFLVLLQISLSIVAGGYFALQGKITLGELLSFFTYVGMVSWPLRQVGRILSQMGMATVAIERIFQVLSVRQEDYEPQGISQPKPLRGDIVFDHVYFKYQPHTEKHVLQGISFRIKAGETVAFVGPAGSGKSTIINLLTRFYDPDAGTIYVDGQSTLMYDKPFLRDRIGLVLQKAFLFSASIRDNIAYAAPDADEKAILAAAEMAQAHMLENILAHGFNTVVGEKGVTLSGGQKQRVALARTILSHPDILILDDVTSAVDTETERIIFEKLTEEIRQKTTIIISHRITSIQHADRIFVLEKGRIVQEGNHRELMHQPGYYQQIHQLQSALEDEIIGET